MIALAAENCFPAANKTNIVCTTIYIGRLYRKGERAA